MPRLKIALASGCRDGVTTAMQADSNVTFLPKPFDTAAVNETLRASNAC